MWHRQMLCSANEYALRVNACLNIHVYQIAIVRNRMHNNDLKALGKKCCINIVLIHAEIIF